MQNQVSPDLRRNQDDHVFFGVASGLADYFGIDAAIVRVVFIITALLGFGGTLLIYLLLAILMPKRDKTSGGTSKSIEKYRYRTSDDALLVSRRRQLAGWIVIVLGAVLLAANFGWFQWFSFGRFWPLLLIAFGIALLAGIIGNNTSRSD